MERINIETLSENIKNRAENDMKENSICGVSICDNKSR